MATQWQKKTRDQCKEFLNEKPAADASSLVKAVARWSIVIHAGTLGLKFGIAVKDSRRLIGSYKCCLLRSSLDGKN